MARENISKERAGAFAGALGRAEYGDLIVYHVGEFCAGPHREAAMRASDAGLALLYQKRLGPRLFEYVAKKVRPPK